MVVENMFKCYTFVIPWSRWVFGIGVFGIRASIGRFHLFLGEDTSGSGGEGGVVDEYKYLVVLFFAGQFLVLVLW